MLLLHAKEDPNVTVRHCELMYEAMHEAGADVQIELIDSTTHGRAWRRRRDEVVEFLKARL